MPVSRDRGWRAGNHDQNAERDQEAHRIIILDGRYNALGRDCAGTGSTPAVTSGPTSGIRRLGDSMEYRHLGRAGIRVSELSYGSWVTFSNQLDNKSASGLHVCRLRSRCQLL